MGTLDALKNPKAWWLIGGGVVSGGLIYEFRKSKKSKAAASAAATSITSANAALADASNSSNNSLSGIDPATGLPYDTSGFSNTIPGTAIGSPYASLSGLTLDPSTGQYVSSNTPAAPTTNAQWAQQAEAYLVSVGDDQTAANNAITAYLSGGNGLSSTQYQAIQSALAFIGSPPVTVQPPTLANNAGQKFIKDVAASKLYEVENGSPVEISYVQYVADGGDNSTKSTKYINWPAGSDPSSVK